MNDFVGRRSKVCRDSEGSHGKSKFLISKHLIKMSMFLVFTVGLLLLQALEFAEY